MASRFDTQGFSCTCKVKPSGFEWRHNCQSGDWSSSHKSFPDANPVDLLLPNLNQTSEMFCVVSIINQSNVDHVDAQGASLCEGGFWCWPAMLKGPLSVQVGHAGGTPKRVYVTTQNEDRLAH